MAKLYILALALLCYATRLCNARSGKITKFSDGTLKFPPVRKVDISSDLSADFDGKGLEPWYDVARSFVHTVQKDDLPYDDIKKAKDGDFEAEEFLKGWELPFLVVFAIGVLFALIVPIVGICFCCCRCCGNCGGEMSQKPSSKNDLKRAIFAVSLSIITLLMFTGCLMAFVSNDRITDTVDSYKTTPVTIVREAEKYFNETLDIVTEEVINNVIDVLEIVLNDVLNLPNSIATEVKSSLAESVRDPLNSVIKLADETEKMEDLLRRINSTSNELQTRFITLQNNLSDVITELDTQCPFYPECLGLNYSAALGTVANFSTLPSVTTELNNIADINKNNLAGNAEEGLKEFDSINETIAQETNSATTDIKVNIADANSTFVNEIERDIVDKVNKDVLHRTDGWVKDIEDAYEDDIKPYDKYRYYAGVGITCLILLPVVLMAVGLLCGICGHDKNDGPTERGAISNLGGNCLMAASGFMFIFVFFLMLFCSICFILGANFEKACYSVREEKLFKDFLDNPKYWDGDYLLGKEIYDNGSLKLTIEDILSSCRRNEAIFQAIQGYQKWNLTEKFGVKDKLGGIDKDLEAFDIPLQGQDILNNDTKNGLEELRNSGVNNIGFEEFLNVTTQDVVNNAEIDELQTSLNGSGVGALVAISIRVGKIQAEANSMKTLSDKLDKDVRELNDVGGNISKRANETLALAEEAEKNYKENVNFAVTKAVNIFKNQILGYIVNASSWAATAVEEDIGHCKILTDIYDAGVNLLCRDTVYPFNGYWFSIGFCLLFYIPAIILCIKLAKHYRRMRFEEGFDKNDGMEMTHVGRNKPWLNQG